MQFRTPEILLGCFLTIAVFSMGMIFSLSGTQNEAAKNSPARPHETGQTETPDDRIAKYTLWLAILTGGLVVVSGIQGYFLLRADKTARITAEAAQAQTHNFTKLERPYIYVYGAKGLECDFDQPDPYDFLKYSVANYGKTPATIESARLKICVGESPQTPTAVQVWHSLVARPIVTPNERREDLTETVPFEIATSQYADENTPPSSLTVPDLEDGTEFYFWVQITYRGPFSVGHETSACWRWDEESVRLIKHGGDEYNFTR